MITEPLPSWMMQHCPTPTDRLNNLLTQYGITKQSWLSLLSNKNAIMNVMSATPASDLVVWITKTLFDELTADYHAYQVHC